MMYAAMALPVKLALICTLHWLNISWPLSFAEFPLIVPPSNCQVLTWRGVTEPISDWRVIPEAESISYCVAMMRSPLVCTDM